VSTVAAAGGASATTAIVIAVISLVASVLTAVVAGIVKVRSDDRITRLTKRLDEEGRERDARRDYEYEAKKRLYEQCEPLLFQALELSESARDRVVSLARSARNGVIRPDGTGWLAAPGYYFTSTAYWLLAPMTTFKLLQSRLTSVDLGLEPRLREQYELLKVLYLSFTNDFDLARAKPELDYEPDRTDPGEPNREQLLADEPQVAAVPAPHGARHSASSWLSSTSEEARSTRSAASSTRSSTAFIRSSSRCCGGCS